MDVYKAIIQSDGSLEKLRLRIVVRGDLQNKELVGYNSSPAVKDVSDNRRTERTPRKCFRCGS